MDLDKEAVRRLGYAYRIQGFNRPQQGLARDKLMHVARDHDMFEALKEGYAEAQADEERLRLNLTKVRGTQEIDQIQAPSLIDKPEDEGLDKSIPNDNIQTEAPTITTGAEEREKTMSNINAFQIQKAVPLPPKRRMSNLAAEPKYPFADMNPGDSFEVIGERERNNALNALSKYQSDHPGWRGASRTMGKVDEEGFDAEGRELGVEFAGQPIVRIWRVEAKDLKPNGQLR